MVGEIRIMSEHAGGMFIDQFKNWSILLSGLPVPRKGKPDARESLHLRHERDCLKTSCHSERSEESFSPKKDSILLGQKILRRSAPQDDNQECGFETVPFSLIRLAASSFGCASELCFASDIGCGQFGRRIKYHCMASSLITLPQAAFH